MDCTNIVNYMHEESRMCKHYYEKVGCQKCPLGDNRHYSCGKLFNNDNGERNVGTRDIKIRIKIVQKWSDKN